MKKVKMKILINLFFVMLLSSCSTKYKNDTKGIVDLIRNLPKYNIDYYYVVKSDSIEILNGGLPPRFFQDYSKKEIDSRLERDIVIIEFNKDTTVNQLYIRDFPYTDIDVRNFYFKKGDTIKFRKSKYSLNGIAEIF